LKFRLQVTEEMLGSVIDWEGTNSRFKTVDFLPDIIRNH